MNRWIAWVRAFTLVKAPRRIARRLRIENQVSTWLSQLELVVVDLIYQGGLSYMRYAVSDTAEYGDYVSGPKVVNETSRQAMKQLLKDIQDGSFAKRWIEENQLGSPNFLEYRDEDRHHQVEKVGAQLRSRMTWLGAKTAPGMEEVAAEAAVAGQE